MEKTNKKNTSIIEKLGGQKFIVFLVVVALFIFFSLKSNAFFKQSTIIDMLDKGYYVALLSIGVTFPLITGGVDLSIGTGLICYALAGGYIIKFWGVPPIVGILVTIVFGVLIGLLNGMVVSFMEIPPFLTTLCTCMITRGLGSILVGGFGVSWPAAKDPAGWFHNIFKIKLENKSIIPTGAIVILVLVIIMSYVLNHTQIGRYTIAIGSNKEAARLSGVNVRIYHVIAYVISGLFAGMAAIAYAAITPTVQPGSGAGFELEAIGGAIIGGVSASGGEGSIVGSILGVIVICLLKTGLPFIGLQANWQQIITGLVLIAAVLVDVIKRRLSKD